MRRKLGVLFFESRFRERAELFDRGVDALVLVIAVEVNLLTSSVVEQTRERRSRDAGFFRDLPFTLAVSDTLEGVTDVQEHLRSTWSRLSSPT